MTIKFPADGFSRVVYTEDIVIGNVFRKVTPYNSQPAFSDNYITKIDSDSVTLSRPYVSSGEVKVEEYKCLITSLIGRQCWRVVLADNGKPYNINHPMIKTVWELLSQQS